MIVVVAHWVLEKHPQLTEQDVIHAVEHPLVSRPRLGTEPPATAGIGLDGNGREVQWIKTPMDGTVDGWFVFHAMTPPQKKMRDELGE
jgi:hypothetical protein